MRHDAEAVRHRISVGRRAGPARAGRNRHGHSRPMPRSRRWRRRRARRLPALADDSGLERASARRPPRGLHRATGLARRRTRPPCTESRTSWRASGPPRAAPIPLGLVLAWPDERNSNVPRQGLRRARLADPRQPPASATIHASSRTAHSRTTGEMSVRGEERDPPMLAGVSHRARAFRMMVEACLPKR